MSLWQKFRQHCPVASRIPVFSYWAFGQWVRGYDEHMRVWGRRAYE